MAHNNGWIGVDLDGTLAEYNGWKGANHIGAPIGPMVARVKEWLLQGVDVRIMTARVSHDGTTARVRECEEARRAIEIWCGLHLGRALPITCTKDYSMVELWDDRAVQVVPNTGKRADAAVPAPWVAAVREFCDRVDRGEVRSSFTYLKFRALLGEQDGN